jgi:transposase, IS30 family
VGEKYDQLCAEERGTIMAMLHSGSSIRRIAAVLGRAPSTVSREIKRNRPLRLRRRGGTEWMEPRSYEARLAGRRARRLQRKPRVKRILSQDSDLWPLILWFLRLGWSPEQIAGRLKCVSHETIYTAIYAMPRGELKRELIACLRRGRAERRPRGRADRRGQSPSDLPSIHARPPEAQERLLPGHWEGDLLKGSGNRSAVGTLVDRHSLFVMLAKMDGATAQAAVAGFSAAFAPLPAEFRQTLTYDQGKEMMSYKKLAENTGLKIYFADPHSPWQRGICENTNGLLRQYLPKNADLSQPSQRDLDHIAWLLNTRPRKSLGFLTPAEVFFQNCYQNKRAAH